MQASYLGQTATAILKTARVIEWPTFQPDYEVVVNSRDGEEWTAGLGYSEKFGSRERLPSLAMINESKQAVFLRISKPALKVLAELEAQRDRLVQAEDA